MLLIDARRPLQARVPIVLRIGLLASTHHDPSSVERGASLGTMEARRVAAMLGRDVSLVVSSDPVQLVADGTHVLVGGFDEASCLLLGELAERHDRLFLNIGCSSDVLRGARCRRSTFHIAPSDAMRRHASGTVARPADGAVAIESWHASLERYGAAQLNDRYRAQFGASMNSAAWSAWMAVKVAWEAFARTRAFDNARVIAWLEDARTRFDGHKGRALSFRPWDHQMRQPLYAIAGAAGGSIIEVPVVERDGTMPVAAQLDRIGTTAEQSACRWEDA
jgi:ABC-type branched-subunit amino acid transport system substrate-binding protein